MSTIQPVKEIFGAEVAKTIEESQQVNWDLKQALTQEYTRLEKNPPRESDYTSGTYNARIGTSGPFWTIVHTAEREYGLADQSEALKKLLRYGAEALAYEYDEEKASLSQWKQASAILSQYIDESTELVTAFHERNTQGQGGPNESTEQNRILWYQKEVAKTLSQELDIPQSQILHLAILLAGRRMGNNGDIAQRGLDKINAKIEEFDVVTGPHKRRGHGAIVDALLTEDADDVIEELQSECPKVWDEFVERHQKVAQKV